MKKTGLLIITALLIFSFSINVFAESKITASRDISGYMLYTKPPHEDLIRINSTFDDVLKTYLDFSYYKLTREEALSSAIRNFLSQYPDASYAFTNSLMTAMDPYAGYYPNVSVDEVFNQNQYKGLGVVLKGTESFEGFIYEVYINNAFADSPASKAGIKTGDIIIEINGVDVTGIGLSAIQSMLTNSTGKILMSLNRSGVIVNVSIEKDIINVVPLELTYEKIEGSDIQTANIRIDNFLDEKSLGVFYSMLKEAQGKKVDDLIIDVRGNPGGALMVSLEMINMLVAEKNKKLCTMVYSDGISEPIYSTGSDIKFKTVTVLIDESSASASELLAISLKENVGAVLIGKKTLGKAIGQSYFALNNGDTVGVTIFELLSPSGIAYNTVGINPDIVCTNATTGRSSVKFEQLNFINCTKIRRGTTDKSILALNQRLAAIGYLNPNKITSEFGSDTSAALHIFQQNAALPVGDKYIDITLIKTLNSVVDLYSTISYYEKDAQKQCALIKALSGKTAAEKYAGENK